MKVTVIGEYGADFALFGIGLSYGITSKVRLNNALDFEYPEFIVKGGENEKAGNY